MSNLPLLDFSKEASTEFGNYRVPAALLSGVSFGQVFALPLNPTDSPEVQLVKRVYLLVALGTLAANLLTVVVSTVTANVIGRQSRPAEPAETLSIFMMKNFELEATLSKVFFYFGFVGFMLTIATRSFFQVTCPAFAKVSVLMMLSVILLTLGVIESGCSSDPDIPSIGGLILSSFRLVCAKALHPLSGGNLWFTLSTAVFMACLGYTYHAMSHVYLYYSKVG